jgi:histidyl-tRNA synthetase
MASTNPARGMRDFLPSDVRKREYVIGIIKEVYESYGFEPLETPAVENLDTLMGKYGEEGNQLIFKILKRGEKLDLENTAKESDLSDLALRYDLTVPLARVVAHHRYDLPKFFKRYQIQPVWRADRPARGRFREFYQCDVDAIGSSSVTVEAEQMSAVCEVLEKLGFKNFSILLNHRELLRGILQVCEIPDDRHGDALVALDKLDKIGKAGVSDELSQRGIESGSIDKLLEFIALREKLVSSDTDQSQKSVTQAFNDDSLKAVAVFAGESEPAVQAIGDLKSLMNRIANTKANGWVRISPTLARGLSYYTGAIMEIGLAPEADHDHFGVSIGGGGRYDGLIGMFGKEQIPACGFSLGLERILVVMEERGMFPPHIAESAPADVMVTIWSEDTAAESLKLAGELRQQGLRVTVYPDPDKLGKQIKYADQIKVPYVCVLGETEINDGTVTIKNMTTGEQASIAQGGAAEFIRDQQ